MGPLCQSSDYGQILYRRCVVIPDKLLITFEPQFPHLQNQIILSLTLLGCNRNEPELISMKDQKRAQLMASAISYQNQLYLLGLYHTPEISSCTPSSKKYFQPISSISSPVILSRQLLYSAVDSWVFLPKQGSLSQKTNGIFPTKYMLVDLKYIFPFNTELQKWLCLLRHL